MAPSSVHDPQGGAVRIDLRAVQRQLEEQIVEIGEHTVIELGIHGLHKELIRMVGRMRFRSSYGQNLLMVHNWFNDRPSFNAPAWSISSEWFAYLLAPILFVALGGRKLMAMRIEPDTFPSIPVGGSGILRSMDAYLADPAAYARRVLRAQEMGLPKGDISTMDDN